MTPAPTVAASPDPTALAPDCTLSSQGRPGTAPDWQVSDTPVPYPDALAAMEAHAHAIRAHGAPERVWLLQHPPLYTAGTSARPCDLVAPDRFPVYTAGRGGQYTYHGPGQRVAYVMLDLAARDRDVRCHVHRLEAWMIRTLARFDIRAERRDGRVGIWVVRDDGREDKIAAIGVRVRRWVTLHGVALNVDPDLSHYDGIVPCGIREHGVTSLRDLLGHAPPLDAVDTVLRETFADVFEARTKP